MPKTSKKESNSTNNFPLVLVIPGKTNDATQVKFLFRGDSRPPEEIFKRGFYSHGKSKDLYLHVISPGYYSYKKSGYISTSVDKKVAEKHSASSIRVRGFLYEIYPKKSGIDVRPMLKSAVKTGRLLKEDFSIYAAEKEIAIPERIKPSDISRAWEVKIDVHSSLRSKSRIINSRPIENPYFFLSRVTKLAKVASHSLMGTAAAIDGYRLYHSYELSQYTSDYSQFFQESAAVIGGWSGALAAGSVGAKLAAVSCSPLGPIAILGCGIGGGVVGSISGYLGGGKSWVSIYMIKKRLSLRD